MVNPLKPQMKLALRITMHGRRMSEYGIKGGLFIQLL